MPATLIVGLGGMGGRVVQRIVDMAEAEGLADVEFVVMDTDVNDLRNVKKKYPKIHIVQTSPNGTVGAALDQNHHAREKWFPVNDGLTGKPFTEGAGQIRAVSRLAFDHAVACGYMSELERAIEKLHGISGDNMRQEMRIMIVGSNNGGTGSGLILPVAMYIRNFLITRYQDNSAIIRGFFLEPDTIFDYITDEEERNSLRANAYASVREIDAFFRKEYSGESDEFRHVVFNAPQPGSGKRIDYPNILPYHFVFLMDAINSEGERLPDHPSYLQHAAESIYAQTLSAVSARSNSSEDNIIRNLAANNGRSRYCGAGSAYLEYPVKKIQRYLGLKWAAQSISEEWLEIDHEYDERHREDDELVLRDFYLTSFESKRGTSSFYKRISRNVEYRDPETGLVTEPARDFPDEVIEHANQVNDSNLIRHCAELARIVNGRDLAPLPTDSDDIQSLLEDDDVSSLEAQFNRFFDAATRYNQAVSEEVVIRAENLAQSAYSVSNYDSEPLVTNSALWQVESMLSVDNGGKAGCMHPGAVRYMLYTASQELETQIGDATDAINMNVNKIKAISRNYQQDEQEDKEESSRKKKGIKLPFLNKDKGLDDASLGALISTAEDLESLKKAIDNRRAAIVQKAFLTAAKDYVDALSKAYEGFYSYLAQQITSIETEVQAIEFDSNFNAAKGRTHKYVCANTTCLQALAYDCPVKGDSSQLPKELCADIYTSLLKYTKVDKSTRDNDVKGHAFKGLFQSTVIDYWVNLVMDPVSGYPQIVDKNVAQAIASEAMYTCDEVFLDKEEEAKYIRSYMEDTLDQAYHLAAPFIEPPVGETPRTFKTCAYSEGIFENAGVYDEVLRSRLNDFNGTALEAKDYSKYSIMFYRSMYGFCAENLPKYAPERNGVQHVPEGEYHRVYFQLVDQLSPNLKENKLITPHIDRNWHLVTALPDLNERYEREIHQKTVRAYIYGLMFQRFGSECVSSGDDIFYMAASANMPRMDLWVSNGTPCDRFYEVYDAMKYNPKAVSVLVSHSDERMLREKNQAKGLSITNCDLLEYVRSQAFTADFTQDADKIVQCVASLPKADPKKATYSLPSAYVTQLFKLDETEESRQSILSIPLYYRISLPQSEFRSGEIETMIECIFDIISQHFANFCDEMELDDQTGRFFEEQYLLFERNLIFAESHICPGIEKDRVVNAIREKTLSFMEPVDRRFRRMGDFKNRIENAWREYRAR